MSAASANKRQIPQLIVALDVDTLAEAAAMVDALYPTVKIFKVGFQLFTGCGPEIIKVIRAKKAEVFLDLKFFDIPNTVAHALRQVTQMQVKMLTLHILGDEEMLRGAVEAAREESARTNVARPLLIGVTVLTSKEANPKEVLFLAKIGIESGLDGVVCSVREARLLRQEIKKDFVIVTPGIRPKTAAANDQKRVASVEDAAEAGSNFIVVGRPILEAKEPIQVASEIVKACEGG